MSKPEISVFDDPDLDAEERDADEAEADVKAGRVVPHEDVVKWLRTWGTPDAGPPPKAWGLDD